MVEQHTAEQAINTLLDAARITGIHPSPLGQIIATVQQLDGAGTSYVHQFYDISTPEPVRLIRSDESVSNPQTDRQGQLFFLSSRAPSQKVADAPEQDVAGTSLWALPARGEAVQLATRPWGFNRFRITDTCLVAQMRVHSQAADEAEHAELVQARTTAKVSGILHSTFPSRYWDQDLPAGRTVLAVAELPSLRHNAQGTLPEVELSWLTLPAGRLVNWEVSQDGTVALLAMVEATSEAVDTTVLYRMDVPSGDTTELLRAPAGQDFEVGPISPDATRALIGFSYNWTPEQNLTVATQVLDLTTAERSDLWPEHDYWLSPVWVTDHTVAATGDDHGAGAIWLGSVADAAPTRLTPDHNDAGAEAEQQHTPARHYSALATLPAHNQDDAGQHTSQLFALADHIDCPPYPVRLDVTGQAQQRHAELTELENPATPLVAPGSMRLITATAEDGTTVRAWLRVPEGSGPHPLVSFIHGGPWGSWNAWTYRWNPNPFVEAGYAVLLPDPAISTGYGQHMIDRGQQQLGGTPYTDLLALIDAAVAEPDIDAERTALAGGSYGGYMANWMAGHTGDRFRCIITHASLWDVTSMGRSTDNAEWARAMVDQADTYSPHLYAENIQVPLLVIHGDRDYRVPIGQALELWHALHTRTPAIVGDDGASAHRYLYFPDEGHWILSRGNAEAWYRTVLGFLNQHVLGQAASVPSTLG